MRSSQTKLSDAEIDSLLQELPQWTLRDGTLMRETSFPDFAEAMLFVNRIAELAEEANHHPDIDIRYNRVKLALVSHDAGGITARDARMARQICGLFP